MAEALGKFGFATKTEQALAELKNCKRFASRFSALKTKRSERQTNSADLRFNPLVRTGGRLAYANTFHANEAVRRLRRQYCFGASSELHNAGNGNWEVTGRAITRVLANRSSEAPSQRGYYTRVMFTAKMSATFHQRNLVRRPSINKFPTAPCLLIRVLKKENETSARDYQRLQRPIANVV